MKMNKKKLKQQQHIISKKLLPWLTLRGEKRPPCGWIQAIRLSLGMSGNQLAKRLGIGQAALSRMESREPEGKVTMESMEKIAKAMNCQFLYAIVPQKEFDDLHEIVLEKSLELAEKMIREVSHNMALEGQDISEKEKEKRIRELAHELSTKLDSKIWN